MFVLIRKLYLVGIMKEGRHSSVGIATRYCLDGPVIESRWGRCEISPYPSRLAPVPTQLPTQ